MDSQLSTCTSDVSELGDPLSSKEAPETPPNTPLLFPKTTQPETFRNQDGRPESSRSLSPMPYSLTQSDVVENTNGVCRATTERSRRNCRRGKPPHFLGLAVIVSLCNCPLGVLAIIFACLSTGDFSRGDIEGARNKGQVAKWLSIVGFVSSVLIAVMVAMYFIVIERNIVRSYEDLISG